MAPPSDPVLRKAIASVAAFLSSSGMNATLEVFARESKTVYPWLHLQDSLDEVENGVSVAVDVRDLVESYLAEAERKERQATDKVAQRGLLDIPTLEEELRSLDSQVREPELPTSVSITVQEVGNVLSLGAWQYPQRSWDSALGRFEAKVVPSILTTSVSRTLRSYTLPDLSPLATLPSPTPSPILSVASTPAHPRLVAVATMDGAVAIYDGVTAAIVWKQEKVHTKFNVGLSWSVDGKCLASIGYDRRLVIFEVVPERSTDGVALLDGEEPDFLSQATSTVKLVEVHVHEGRTNPEAVQWLPKVDGEEQWLCFSLRDEHRLFYLRVGDWKKEEYNLNPNGDGWTSFSVLSIALHPTLPLLSLLTSTSTARVLLYPFHSSTRLSTLYTSSEQTDLGPIPRQSWSPCGRYVAVTSEDGIVRILTVGGRILRRIPAHVSATALSGSASTIVKDVELVEIGEGKLALLSCGFDRTVRLCL